MDVIPASLMELYQRIPAEGEGRSVISSAIKAQEKKKNLGFFKSLQTTDPSQCPAQTLEFL